VAAEAMEAFSFYGMQSLLVLYMLKHLLLPGHVERIAGFVPFRSMLEHVYGPLSAPALASAVQGLFAGSIYLTPMAGGFLADRLLGRTRTIVLGAALMSAGHFLMAFEASFLPALACLGLGAGCFGSNIATQLGELYEAGDARRADAFQIFQLGLTIAVIFAPIICGALGERVAWHWGFGAAGMGMLLGLAAYLVGLPVLPQKPRPSRARRQARPKAEAAEMWAVLALVALLPALMLAMLGNQEIFNAYIVWGDRTYDLVFFGRSMPVSWLVSLDAFLGAGVSLLTIWFWRVWNRHCMPVDEITRVAIGAALMAAAPLTLALASAQATASGHRVGLAWGVAFHVINNVGFANLYPVAMALFSRAAPPRLAGLMMGVFKLHLFAASLLVGFLGGLVSTMSGTRFWLLHAGLIGAGAVLLVLLRAAFRQVLAPAPLDAHVAPEAQPA
jgi:POT family proton-dependent oligopeptide transporter